LRIAKVNLVTGTQDSSTHYVNEPGCTGKNDAAVAGHEVESVRAYDHLGQDHPEQVRNLNPV
ncbi:MAG: hypothetical protein MZV63_18765, partial [Marinilabiliales bacterium]|nr:hypothetical protein [Marinilabiliales bacterium]